RFSRPRHPPWVDAVDVELVGVDVLQLERPGRALGRPLAVGASFGGLLGVRLGLGRAAVVALGLLTGRRGLRLGLGDLGLQLGLLLLALFGALYERDRGPVDHRGLVGLREREPATAELVARLVDREQAGADLRHDLLGLGALVIVLD